MARFAYDRRIDGGAQPVEKAAGDRGIEAQARRQLHQQAAQLFLLAAGFAQEARQRFGRIAQVAQRSWAFGVSSAAGSFGQFGLMPIEQQMISSSGRQNAFYLLAAL